MKILAKKALVETGLKTNTTLTSTRATLIKLFTITTKDQLFQFNGDLYKQVDGVAMGSPLGPLTAHTFTCSIEEKLARENKLPDFYERYVDDTFALVPDLAAATDFLSVLNDAHPAIQFTMETAVNSSLPFVGMVINKIDYRLNTCVYRKKRPTKGFYSIIRAILTIDINDR